MVLCACSCENHAVVLGQAQKEKLIVATKTVASPLLLSCLLPVRRNDRRLQVHTRNTILYSKCMSSSKFKRSNIRLMTPYQSMAFNLFGGFFKV